MRRYLLVLVMGTDRTTKADDMRNFLTCATLTLPDGYNGHQVALDNRPVNPHASWQNDGVVKLARAEFPGQFARHARMSDSCSVCGQSVASHLEVR